MNIIQSADLEHALSIQKTDRIPLGQLALQRKLIDNKQLFRILSRQRKPEDKHKNFGTLAVEMGYLDRDQVEMLLEQQTHTNRLLGEILVSLSLVSQINLIKALKKFRSEDKKN
jgi:hypothetical protein